MRHSLIRRRLKNGVIVQIGLAWLALLAVPAIVQIVHGEEITTIGDPPQGVATID